MGAEESKLFWDLQRYLMKNGVNHGLSLRIQKYLEHAWKASQESMPITNVKLIRMLSEQLTSELRYELAMPHLKIHPFLAELCRFSVLTGYRIAGCALDQKLPAAGDVLFYVGE